MATKKPGSVPCLLCGEYQDSERALRRHQRLRHPSPYVEVAQRRAARRRRREAERAALAPEVEFASWGSE